MFTYCNNNPISLSDSQGDSATIAGGIVGGIFGFVSALMSEASDDKEGGPKGIRWDKVWKCTLSSAGAGAAAGFFADVAVASFGAVPAIFISAGAGAIFTGANSAYTQYTLTGQVDKPKVVSDALLGGLTNGLCTGTSSQLTPLADGILDGINYAERQLAAEIAYGVNSYGSFLANDFWPTFVTGFGAWFGGMEYDYITG